MHVRVVVVAVVAVAACARGGVVPVVISIAVGRRRPGASAAVTGAAVAGARPAAPPVARTTVRTTRAHGAASATAPARASRRTASPVGSRTACASPADGSARATTRTAASPASRCRAATGTPTARAFARARLRAARISGTRCAPGRASLFLESSLSVRRGAAGARGMACLRSGTPRGSRSARAALGRTTVTRARRDTTRAGLRRCRHRVDGIGQIPEHERATRSTRKGERQDRDR